MKIMGTSVLTKNQMLEFVKTVNPNPLINTSIGNLIQLFLDEGEIEGVRGDIAFVQATWETNNFKFTGDVVPEQNNFAGIGTTGGGVKGHYFDTPQLGVRAQIQHLKAYASKDKLVGEQIDPRYHLVNPKGKATTVQGLSGTWAADKNYGKRLNDRYNEILKLPGGGNVAIKVMIDAGHGAGKNHNRGYRGKLKNEGDANWIISQALDKWLTAYGIAVAHTRPKQIDRPNDNANDLAQRRNLGKGCDLFISMHSNAHTVNQGTGAEVWIYYSGSKDLALRLVNTASSTLGITNRGVKTGSYAVLNGNKADYSMLVESAFHTNDKDVKVYEDKMDLLAYNYATQIARYFGITKKVDFNNSNDNNTIQEDIDLMDRGQIEFIAYSDTTDKKALQRVEDYFKATKIPYVLVHKNKPFNFEGVKRLFVVDEDIRGYSTYPKQWILIKNMEQANKFYATQNNWKDMTYNRMPK